MSYLIHNFFWYPQRSLITPRQKLQIFVSNIYLIFSFFNLQHLVYVNFKYDFWSFSPLTLHTRLFNFFFDTLDQIIIKSNESKPLLVNDNKLYKSYTYWIYRDWLNLLNHYVLCPARETKSDVLLFNQMWFPIKILNVNPMSNFFNSIFFYCLFYCTTVWFFWTNKFIYTTNFIFLSPQWNLLFFAYGPFSRVSNL